MSLDHLWQDCRPHAMSSGYSLSQGTSFSRLPPGSVHSHYSSPFSRCNVEEQMDIPHTCLSAAELCPRQSGRVLQISTSSLRWTKAANLNLPDPDKLFMLEVDALETGVGAILSQWHGEPLKYFYVPSFPGICPQRKETMMLATENYWQWSWS